MINFKKPKKSKFINKPPKFIKEFFQLGGQKSSIKIFESKEKAFERAKEIADKTGGSVRFDEKTNHYVIDPKKDGSSPGLPGFKPGEEYEGDFADPKEYAKKLAKMGITYEDAVEGKHIPAEGYKHFFPQEERVGFKSSPPKTPEKKDPYSGYDYTIGQPYSYLTNPKTGEKAFTKEEQLNLAREYYEPVKDDKGRDLGGDLVYGKLIFGMSGENEENTKPIVTTEKQGIYTGNMNPDEILRNIEHRDDSNFFREKTTSSENSTKELSERVDNKFNSTAERVKSGSYEDMRFKDEYGNRKGKKRERMGNIINNKEILEGEKKLTKQAKSNAVYNNRSFNDKRKELKERVKVPQQENKKGGTFKDRMLKAGGVLKGKQNTLPKFLQEEILKNGGIKKSIKSFDNTSKNNIETFINYKRKR